MVATVSAPLALHPAGPVAGSAWVERAPVGFDLHVIGKLALQLGQGGTIKVVSKPELPGWNQGRTAKEELAITTGRQLLVRGHRTQPGRVILRRGVEPVGEIEIEPGVAIVGISLDSTAQATIGGKRGEDWLVIEGVEGQSSRRWCKLPKLGLVASWGEIERMTLASRICMVDVSSWTITFVMRATRRVPEAMVPKGVVLSVMDLSQAGAPVAVTAGSGTYAAAAPPQAAAPLAPTAVPPAAVPPAARARPDIQDPPTMISAGVTQARPLAADDDETVRVKSSASSDAATGRTRQLGPEEVARLLAQERPRPLEDAADELPTRMLPSDELRKLTRAIDRDEPSAGDADEVSRAFAAIAPAAGPAATQVAERAELERRAKEGAPSEGLALRGAALAGARLAGAKLADADLSGADLSRADLSDSTLSGAKLDGTNLDGACLERASLDFASLRGASLRAAKLEGATFAGADLRDADLRGATPASALMGADLAGAKRA